MDASNFVFDEIEYNQEYKILKTQIETWYDKNVLNSEDKELKGLLQSLKKNEIYDNMELYKTKKESFRNDIYSDFSENFIDRLNLEIVFCNTPELLLQWNYYKLTTSSAIASDSFTLFKYMVKDRCTNKYIGIVGLSNDIITKEDRDIYIGWKKYTCEEIKTFEKKKNKTYEEKIELLKWKETNKNLDKIKTDKVKNFKMSGYHGDEDVIEDKYSIRLNHIVNISCCVGLQPVAYNLNVGKLLVASVFSKEVVMEYYRRYHRYYAAVITESLYGKSIQYDRMNEIKYIGMTSGYGTCHIPTDLKEDINTFMKKFHYEEYEKCQKMTSSTMRKITACCRILKINMNILDHGLKRGIYFGYTSDDSKDFLIGNKNKFDFNDKIREFDDIVMWWKDRWAIKRWNYLMETHRVKIKFELYDYTKSEKINQQARQIQFEKMKDNTWVSIKREKNRIYYYENKDKLLEEVKVEVEKDLFKEVYIHPSYLAGFFDGDGSIYISSGCLHINFSQCVLNVLLQIQRKYGGTIFKYVREYRENNRAEYSLKICGEDCRKILNVLKETSILKVERILYGIQYLDYNNKLMSDEKQKIIDSLKRSNEKKTEDDQYMDRINWNYICGIFDAEGCISINYQNVMKGICIMPCLSIAQKYVPNFMNHLQIFMIKELSLKTKKAISLKSIRVSDTAISMNKKILLEAFYDICKNTMIVKKYQYDLLMKIYKEYANKKRDINKLRDYALTMKSNKHTDMDYDIDIDKVNMIAFLKSKVIESIQETKQKEMNTIVETKQLQKEQKRGVKNTNYGKIRSVEHRYKISLSATLKKREKGGLTDEKIHEILSYKEACDQKKISKIEIATKMKIDRNIITGIFMENILPQSHPDFKKKLMEEAQKSYDEEMKHIEEYEKMSLTSSSSSSDDDFLLMSQQISVPLSHSGRMRGTKKVETDSEDETHSESLEEKLDDSLLLCARSFVPNDQASRVEMKKMEAFFARSILTFDEMIAILLWKKKQINNEMIENKKINSTRIAKKFSEELNKHVSHDMVKNLWGYRTQLTKGMFTSSSPITYDEYLDIVHKK